MGKLSTLTSNKDVLGHGCALSYSLYFWQTNISEKCHLQRPLTHQGRLTTYQLIIRHNSTGTKLDPHTKANRNWDKLAVEFATGPRIRARELKQYYIERSTLHKHCPGAGKMQKAGSAFLHRNPPFPLVIKASSWAKKETPGAPMMVLTAKKGNIIWPIWATKATGNK